METQKPSASVLAAACAERAELNMEHDRNLVSKCWETMVALEGENAAQIAEQVDIEELLARNQQRFALHQTQAGISAQISASILELPLEDRVVLLRGQAASALALAAGAEAAAAVLQLVARVNEVRNQVD